MKNLLVLIAILITSSMMSTASANHPEGWPFNRSNGPMLTKSGGFNYNKLDRKHKRAKRWRKNHPCHMFY